MPFRVNRLTDFEVAWPISAPFYRSRTERNQEGRKIENI